MTIGNVGAVGAIPLQIRAASTGSGYWYTGANKPLGICLTWYQSSNAGHIVLGQVAALMAVFGQSLVSSMKNPLYLVLAVLLWGGMYWVSKQFCKKHNLE